MSRGLYELTTPGVNTVDYDYGPLQPSVGQGGSLYSGFSIYFFFKRGVWEGTGNPWGCPLSPHWPVHGTVLAIHRIVLPVCSRFNRGRACRETGLDWTLDWTGSSRLDWASSRPSAHVLTVNAATPPPRPGARAFESVLLSFRLYPAMKSRQMIQAGPSASIGSHVDNSSSVHVSAPSSPQRVAAMARAPVASNARTTKDDASS